MSPADPRHGTQAGRAQHVRDGEDPCLPCIEGDLKARRRRRKRKTMGHVFRREIGAELHVRLMRLRERGASYQQIADWADVSFSQVYYPIINGPSHRVNTSTWERLNAIKPADEPTPIGMTRRVRALMRLGYSLRRIGEEAGVTYATLARVRDGEIVGPLHSRTIAAICGAYDRLHMTPPATYTVSQRKSVTRARNDAAKAGWPPPLAYDDIDNDPGPIVGATTGRTDRASILADLDACGRTIDDAIEVLGVGRDALQKWAKKHGHKALVDRLSRRAYSDDFVRNQHTEGVA